MKIVQGDLIKLALENEFDVIIHGCNCFCTMGAGIAKSVKTTFPEAYEADLKTGNGDRSKLGSISWATIERYEHPIIVVNAYTQFHWRGRGNKADYEAIRNCMKLVKIEFSGKRIGYPMIGAGLAGGDWNTISQIIKEELSSENHTLVQFKP